MKHKLLTLVALLLLFMGATPHNVAAQERNVLKIEDFSAPRSQSIGLPVYLDNTGAITAVEFDVTAPEGITLQSGNCIMSSRATDHVGVYRAKTARLGHVMVYSPTNTPLQGQSGLLLTIPMEIGTATADGQQLEVSLENIVICASDANNIATGSQNGHVTVEISPDLRPVNVKIGTTGVQPGDSISLSWSVENIGEAATTGGWSETITLVGPDGSEKSLGRTFYNDILGSGASVERQGTMLIPLVPGMAEDCFIKVTVNPNSDCGESMAARTNNSATDPIGFNVGKKLYLTTEGDETVESYPGLIRLTLQRSGFTDMDETFRLAVEPEGYLNMPEAIIIPAGRSNASVYFSPIDNDVLNPSGNLVITASQTNGSYYSVSKNYTIIDDEQPELTLNLSASDITEGESVTLTITTNRVDGSDVPLTLYASRNGCFNIPAGISISGDEHSAVIGLQSIDNDIAETLRDCVITVTAPGHKQAAATILIDDNDVPEIELTLSTNRVNENAGLNAIMATLTRRTLTGNRITVNLSQEPAGNLYLQQTSIEMTPGLETVQFPIGVIDNTQVDGTRDVTLTAAVYIKTCDCSVSGTSGGVVSQTITIIDNDGPALTASTSSATVAEGSKFAITVSRNTDTDEALPLHITTDAPERFNFNTEAEIPAGQRSTTIEVEALSNATDGDDVTGVFTVSAEGYSDGICWVLVSDRTIADAELTRLEVDPISALIGSDVSIKAVVSNRGVMPIAATTVDLSFYGVKMMSLPVSTAIAPGDSVIVEGILAITGLNPGKHILTAEVNPNHTFAELLTTNNSQSVEIEALPSFTATVSADKDIYMPGEKVTIIGQTHGINTALAQLEIYLRNEGSRQTIAVTTDASGAFSAQFTPASRQSGHFIIGACYPGVTTAEEESEFDIRGMQLGSAQSQHELIVGHTGMATLSINNPGRLPITGLKVELNNPTENFKVEVEAPTEIAAGTRQNIKFNIEALGATNGTNWQTVEAKITTNEGLEGTYRLYLYSQIERGSLRSSVNSINTTMTKGATREYQFVITNQGGGETGDISLSLPQNNWMKSATAVNMPSLQPGESATIVLSLSPGDDLPLNINQQGTIGVNCANGNGLAIPYSIETVSDATGTVDVDVCDEFTFADLDGGPHVAEATVTFKHPVTGAIVAQGKSGDDGICSLTLPEGYYILEVTHPSHDSYRISMEVAPGRTTRQLVALSYSAIKIDYRVEETEVEDVYDIVTEVKFETNVPRPVVEMKLPERIEADMLGDGASLLFNVELTNHGLITAQDVSLEMPEGFNHLTFEPLSHTEPFDMAAGETLTIPVRVTRHTSGPAKVRRNALIDIDPDYDPCSGKFRLGYYWDCGPDRKWHRYELVMQMGVTNCEGYNLPALSQSTTTVTPGSGGGGGGYGPTSGPGIWGPGTPVVGDEDIVRIPVITLPLECEPCQNRWIQRMVPCLRYIPVIDLACNTVEWTTNPKEKFKETVKDAIEDAIWDAVGDIFPPAGVYHTLKGVWDECLQSFFEPCDLTVPDLGDNQGGDNQGGGNQGGGNQGGDSQGGNNQGGNNQGGNNNNNDNNDTEDEFPGYMDPKFPEGATSTGPYIPSAPGPNGYPEKIRDYQGKMRPIRAILASRNNRISRLLGKGDEWKNSDPKVIRTYIRILSRYVTGEVPVDSVMAALPPGYTPERGQEILDLWYNSYNEVDGADTIDMEKFNEEQRIENAIIEGIHKMGYESLGEYFTAINKEYNDYMNESESSVCSSVTLQFSQQMVMTRQAFRGTLTVHNGSTETPMENVVLNVTITDPLGNMATLREFEYHAESLTNFSGECTLGQEWSLAPGADGVATVLFIPTRYAAPSDDVNYTFGGTLSYTDPFSGQTQVRQLNPVTLSVKPSPSLELNYFMQRDVFADDPLTVDVVEPSLPAEFSLLINNTGAGDATNLRMLTRQPEIVDNEKGLKVDFNIFASELNGANKTLTMGNTANDFGTITAGQTAYAQWWFTSSLLGHFTDYDITVNHLTSYGNPDLTLIESASIHELVRSLNLGVNEATQIMTKGFMVDDDRDGQPELIYVSNGTTEPVSTIAAVTATMQDDSYLLTVTPDATGWNYGSILDPTYGLMELVAVTNITTGQVTDPRNFWQTDRTMRDGMEPLVENCLHFADTFADNAPMQYLLQYAPKSDVELGLIGVSGIPQNGEIAPAPIETITLTFNTAVNPESFTADDLRLSVEGIAVDNLSSITVAPVDESDLHTFTVNLKGLTHADGYYVLVVDTKGISDTDNFAGRDKFNVVWNQQSTYPMANMTLQMAEGWNWLSLPIVGTDTLASYEQLFKPVDHLIEAIEAPSDKISPTLFKIKASENVNLTVQAPVYRADSYTIQLQPGWNPLPYLPIESATLSDALCAYEASPEDIVKSHDAFAVFNGKEWVGTLTAMHPGDGYMYFSGKDAEFTYPSGLASYTPRRNAPAAAELLWSSNHHQHAENMTIVAQLYTQDETLREQPEEHIVGAFSDDECRGTGSHVASLHFITLHGEEYEPMQLRVADGQSVEYAVSEKVTFSPNETLGSLAEPIKLHVSNTPIILKGVEMQTGGAYGIKPTMVTDCVEIIGDLSAIESLNVISTDGRPVYTTAVSERKVNLSTLPSGIYVAEIVTSQGSSFHKFIKK